jgi:protein-disulfide isomerase
MDSSEVEQRVQLDVGRGAAIGVKNTPTIFINNEAVPGPKSNPEELPGFIEAALKKGKPSS